MWLQPLGNFRRLDHLLYNPLLQILEKSLVTLFSTRDLSLVKSYLQRQLTKIIDGSASLQDLTFAKEFRGEAGYRPNAKVPALKIARWAQVHH